MQVLQLRITNGGTYKGSYSSHTVELAVCYGEVLDDCAINDSEHSLKEVVREIDIETAYRMPVAIEDSGEGTLLV